MRSCALVILAVLALAIHGAEPTVSNGAMEGPAVDHSNGKGLLLTPAGWTPVNPNTGRGDRLSVVASDRPGAGQCLHVHAFGSDAGVYQTIAPLVQGSTYLVTAWVKRLSGALAIEAYPQAWGPAVMRRVDDQSTGWTQLTVGLTAVDGGAHLYLVAWPEAEFLIDAVEIRPAPIQVSIPELLPYDLSPTWRYRLTLAANAGFAVPAEVEAQAVADRGAGQALEPRHVVQLAGANPTAVTVERPLDAEDSFAVEVRQPGTGEVLGASPVSATPGSPWIVSYPHKHALYASLDYGWPLRVGVLTATPAMLATLQAVVTITDRDGRAVRQATGMPAEDGLVVPLDGRGLAPGDYRMRLVVRQIGGPSVHEAARPLRVLVPAANEVVVAPTGDTLVQGHRFFPIGLYWVLADPAGWRPGPARQTTALNELRQAGFNTLHSYAFEHNDSHDTDDDALAYLDMAQELGFRVMLGLRRDWCQGAEVNVAAIEQRVTRLKGHPALLCWTLWDEPDASLSNVPRVQALYDLVDRLDPYHPAMPVFMSGGGRAFRTAADVNLFDCYPGAGKAEVLPAVLARARVAIPEKPIWYVAQAYQQGDKLPSESDMRLYWQYALAANAKAVFWYSYGGDGRGWDSIRITPEHYANVRRAVRALADQVGAR
jgi:hypothetical protein